MKDNKLSRRTFICNTSLAAAGLTASLTSAVGQAARAKAPHILFVTGDDEYRSEITMPFIAQLLGRKRQFKCAVLWPNQRANWPAGRPQTLIEFK